MDVTTYTLAFPYQWQTSSKCIAPGDRLTTKNLSVETDIDWLGHVRVLQNDKFHPSKGQCVRREELQFCRIGSIDRVQTL